MKPIRVLFICHGNICRSPMAEFVMKKLVHEAGVENEFYIESAATSAEELGNGVYPPVRRLLSKHGIDCSEKTARQITRRDYENFDYIIGMDGENLRRMNYVFNGDPEGKVSLLMDYTSQPGSVSDPWYTRDFESTWRDVNEGCREFLNFLQKKDTHASK